MRACGTPPRVSRDSTHGSFPDSGQPAYRKTLTAYARPPDPTLKTSLTLPKGRRPTTPTSAPRTDSAAALTASSVARASVVSGITRGFYRGTRASSQAARRRRRFGGEKLADCTRHGAPKLYNARRKPDKNLSAGARLRLRLAEMIPKSERGIAPVRVRGAARRRCGPVKSTGAPPCVSPATSIQHQNFER